MEERECVSHTRSQKAPEPDNRGVFPLRKCLRAVRSWRPQRWLLRKRLPRPGHTPQPGVTGRQHGTRRARGFPSALLPALASAPPGLSSSPASPPTPFGAAGVTQNPWFQPPGDPVVLPTVKDGRSAKKKGGKKFLLKHV